VHRLAVPAGRHCHHRFGDIAMNPILKDMAITLCQIMVALALWIIFKEYLRYRGWWQ
jgi:hypothetical protein